MKRLSLLLIALSSLGCGAGWILHPVDPLAQSGGKPDLSPRVFVRLGMNEQVCYTPKGSPSGADAANAVVFIDVYNSDATVTKVVLNEKPYPITGQHIAARSIVMHDKVRDTVVG